MLRRLMRRLESAYGAVYNDLRRARSLLIAYVVILIGTLGLTAFALFEGTAEMVGSGTLSMAVARFAVWLAVTIVSFTLLLRTQLIPAAWVQSVGMALGVAVGMFGGWASPVGAWVVFLMLSALYMPLREQLIITVLYGLLPFAALSAGHIDLPLAGQQAVMVLGLGAVSGWVTNQLRLAFERAERRAASLDTLLEIARSMTSTLALDDMLPDATTRLSQEFDLDRVRVYLLNTDDEAYFTRRIENAGGKIDNDLKRVLPEENALLADTLRERDAITRLEENRLWATFPMMAGRTLVGVLEIYDTREVNLTTREVNALQTFANQLAIAVENTLSMGSEAALLEATNPIFRATQEIATVLDADSIISILRRLIVPDVDRISLVTVGFGPVGEPVTQVIATWDRDGLELDAEFPEAVRAQIGSQQVIVPDSSTLPDEESVLRDYGRHVLRARSFFVNPLIVRDRTVGYLLVAHYTAHEYTEREIRTLETLSGPIGVVLDNLTLLESLSSQAERLGDINELALGAVDTENLVELAQVVERALIDAFDLTYLSYTRSGRGGQANVTTFTEGRITAADFTKQRGGDLPERPIALTGTSIEAAMDAKKTIHHDTIPRPDLDSWVPDFVHSLLVIPLLSGGTLNLGFGLEQIIEPDDINFAEQVAAIFNAMLDKNLYLEAVTKQLEESTALYSMSLALNAAESLDEIYETALFETASVTQAERVLIYIAGPDPREEIEYVAQAALLDHGRLVIDENPVRYVIEDAPIIAQFPQSRANLVFNNAPNDPRLNESIRESFAVRGVNAALAVPIATGATWLGAIIAEKFGEETFNSEALRRARSVSDQTALAIDSQQLLERFQSTVARERALREVSDLIRGATDRDMVMDIAAREVSQVIGVSEDEAQVITSRTTQRQKLSSDERELIDSITNQVDLAIQNLSLLEAAEQAAFREQLINEMTVDLQRAVTVNDVMRTAVELLAQSLGDYDITLKLSEQDRRLIEGVVRSGGTGPLPGGIVDEDPPNENPRIPTSH